MNCAWLLFGFKGRLNRAKYLVVELALLACWLMLWFRPLFSLAPQWEGLRWAVAIAMIWINMATVVKRLHDRGRSGWWAVAVFVVNRLSYLFYGLYFGLYFGVDISVARQLLLVMLVVAFSLLQTWIVIELFFLIGTDGPNRFGPDPTRTTPNYPVASRAASEGIPDFLIRRTGPGPT
jgi:uncharacterized membrane protein YhaH (DUF805 family)